MKKSIVFLLGCLLSAWVLDAHPGIGIVMDNEGNVFYTDLVHVWKISPEGEQTIAVRNVHTHELYLDANGDLYGEHEWYEGEATDKWGNYVWCLSKDGAFEKVIPDVEGFLDNTTLVRDPDGNTYWAKKSGNGEILMKQMPDETNITASSHEFKDIRWMHVSKYDNNLYVVDHLTLKKVSPSGVVEIVASELKEDGLRFSRVDDRHYVFGVWTDSTSDVYVALYGAGKVIKINSNGEKSTVFESDRGWSPCGGMIAADGTMWIMEFSRRNKTRVTKVVPNDENIVYGD